MPSSRHRGWFGWLGLFALALQLVLSFGHHRDHHAHGSAGPAETVIACEPGAAGKCRAGAADHDGEDHDGGDEHCAICWAVAVAAGGVLPAPMALTLAAERIVAQAPRAEPRLTGLCPGRLFQARAPPLGASA